MSAGECEPDFMVLLDRLLVGAVAVVAGVSVLALFASRGWVPELFSHFRVQYLALQLPLLVLLSTRRRWRSVALVGLLVLPNAHPLLPYWPSTTEPGEPRPSITLLSANVYGRNHDYARFLELVEHEQPDAMLLLEIDAQWVQALRALSADYPHIVAEPRDGPWGIAFLSRLPLSRAEIVSLRGAPAVDVRVDPAEGRSLRLIGVHLQSPTSRARAGERNAQLADLAARAATVSEPLVVTGDLNVTPYSPLLAHWLERSGLTDARSGRGLAVTWPTFLPLLGIPIDHCLISEHFIVGDQHRGPAFGSDHYPVITRLFLRGNE